MTNEAIQSAPTTRLVTRDMTLLRAAGRVYRGVFDFDDVDESGCRGVGEAAQGMKMDENGERSAGRLDRRAENSLDPAARNPINHVRKQQEQEQS